MSFVILHSANPNSNSMRVVDRVSAETGALACHVESREIPSDPANRWIVVVPNYGDGEVQAVMETFLVNTRLPLHHFAVLELGNYYGFDEWGYGAADKIHRLLSSRGGRPFFSHLAMDTLPKMDWPTLDRWIAALKKELPQ